MKLFGILSRYTTRQLLANFFMVFFAILGIIMLFDSIEALRRVSGRDDLSLAFTMQYALTRITKTVETVIPFVLMVAAMITALWRMGHTSTATATVFLDVSTLCEKTEDYSRARDTTAPTPPARE